MRLRTLLSIAAATVLFGGVASAATVNPDEYLGGYDLANSGPDAELAAFKTVIGNNDLTLETDIEDGKLDYSDVSIMEDDNGIFYIEVDYTPDYFALKTGNISGTDDNFFVFKNVPDKNVLAFDPDFLFDAYGFSFEDSCLSSDQLRIAVDDNGGGCKLSHLTLTSGVPEIPVPAAGWLLIGGLASLAAVRRRYTA